MLHVQTVGEGDVGVVLVHGFMGSGRNLRSLAQRWSELDPSLRFLMPDLTGHGRSPPLPPGADLSTLARDVIETARAEGVSGKLHVVGHSLGGRVGLEAILRMTHEMGSLVVLDVSPGPIDPAVETGPVLDIFRGAPARAASREEMRAYFEGRRLSRGHTEWLLTNLERDENGFVWRVDREALAGLHHRTSAADLWAALGAGVDVRFLRGGASPFVSAEDVRRIEALGVHVGVVEGADHYLHVTHTEEVARHLAAGFTKID